MKVTYSQQVPYRHLPGDFEKRLCSRASSAGTGWVVGMAEAVIRTIKRSYVRVSRRDPRLRDNVNLQVQDAFSVQVTNLLLVLIRDLKMAQPIGGNAIRLIWPVNRKENVICADRQ